MNLNLFGIKGCILLTFLGALQGCATGSLSNRSKSILLTAAVGAAGAAVGIMTAPSDESKALHGLMWGGASAAVSGVASLFLFDSESEKEKLNHENKRLVAELARYSKEVEPVPIGSIPDGADMPGEIRDLIHPGKWQLYQIGEKGQWIKQSERKWIHQDQLLMYIPGAINPNSNVHPGLDSPRLYYPNSNPTSDAPTQLSK